MNTQNKLHQRDWWLIGHTIFAWVFTAVMLALLALARLA